MTLVWSHIALIVSLALAILFWMIGLVAIQWNLRLKDQPYFWFNHLYAVTSVWLIVRILQHVPFDQNWYPIFSRTVFSGLILWTWILTQFVCTLFHHQYSRKTQRIGIGITVGTLPVIWFSEWLVTGQVIVRTAIDGTCFHGVKVGPLYLPVVMTILSFLGLLAVRILHSTRISGQEKRLMATGIFLFIAACTNDMIKTFFNISWIQICDTAAIPVGLSFIIVQIQRSKRLQQELTQMVDERTADLKKQQQTMKAILESSQDWIWTIGVDGIHSYSNPAVLNILGVKPEDIMGSGLYDRLHPEDRIMVQTLWQQSKNTRSGWKGMLLRWQHQDGTYRYLESNSVPILGPTGELLGYHGVDRDITERYLAEILLKESEQRFRTVLENLEHVAVQAYEPDGTITFWNKASENIYGFSSEQVFGKNLLELLHGMENRDEERGLMERAIQTGYLPPAGLIHVIRQDGSRVSVLANRVLHTRSGNLPEFFCFDVDVSQRLQAEEENQRLRIYLNNIIDSVPSVLVGVDDQRRVCLWNIAAARSTGMCADAAMGVPVERVLPGLANHVVIIQEALMERKTVTQYRIMRLINNEPCFEDIAVCPLMGGDALGAVIQVEDVTERVRMEEMMIQSEKMLSIGGLAAGMAHEINNPLGVILNASQNILRRTSLEIPANIDAAQTVGTTLTAVNAYLEKRDILLFLQDIRDTSLRAADIVANILSFSRKSQGEKRPVDIAELLDHTVSLAACDHNLKNQYDFRRIAIEREYNSETPMVICQTGLIQQVFLNILRNGAQALFEIGTGQARG
jgi:PAS domain S-box-containing protein